MTAEVRGGVALVEGPIDTASLPGTVAHPDAGATVLFLGTTRRRTGECVTERLEYEAHGPMAEQMLRTLRDRAVETYRLAGCAVVHRLGVVEVGEASVAVAASAAHRREAFAAAEWLMEEIKRSVPIWKCEESPGGRRAWVHPDGGER